MNWQPMELPRQTRLMAAPEKGNRRKNAFACKVMRIIYSLCCSNSFDGRDIYDDIYPRVSARRKL